MQMTTTEQAAVATRFALIPRLEMSEGLTQIVALLML